MGRAIYDYYVLECTKQRLQSQLGQAGEEGFEIKFVQWLGTNNYLVVMQRKNG